MIILGIDPGTTRIGYGIVERDKGKLTRKKSGLLYVPKGLSENNRLPAIEKSLRKLLIEQKPDRMCIERLFFAKNQKTAIAVAQARGILINTAVKQGIEIQEQTPLQVKIAVTSSGKASKDAVAIMVRKLLGIPETERLIDDITDALAAAIAGANNNYHDVS